jgi:diguanylate cyclase (GGDEF)-like protein
LSNYDAVTGLRNGLHFEQQLNSILFHAAESSTQVALSIVDLIGLREINRERGWDDGDRVLRAFAEQLQSVCGDHDLWHLGGDAFAIAVVGEGDGEAAARFQRLTAALSTHSQTADLMFRWGRAVYPTDGTTVRALVRRADQVKKPIT